ncbi:MAG: efflux RND transporter permease subunit, partial [Bacteroidales bacterium]|nr:efflux RND transporter permease subunit [Bacteroidales bacterium]
YSINVRYDFIGNAVLAEKTADEAVKYMNSEILPVGFHAEKDSYSWFFDSKEKYVGLIMLVIALIFVICTVHFNSLRAPLAIIWMIPISFIGVFIVFGYTGFNFDNGGFAAFVMLSGITVNAGIYMISAWRSYRRNLPEVRRYVRALNIKIWPIFLTVVSTILGLIPFLFDGPRETFWFSFAIGTIAGLVFAMIGFFLYLPVFACKKR